MMKRLSFIATSLAAVVAIVASSAPGVVAAATASNPPSGGQALEIAPPVITLTVNPGQVVHTQISIRDVASNSLIVTGQSNDFVAAGENGTPKILLDQSEKDPYSLKDWISDLPQLLLSPKQVKTLPVTINVPKSASPGGHYGVIRFTATPPDLKGTGVSLSASLGALVMLTVRGDIKHQLAVAQFSVSQNGKTSHLFQSVPLDFTEKIKNIGNVHEEPQGVIVVKDTFGKAVGSVSVNGPARNVLPGSTRAFSEPFNKSSYGTRHFFGHYTATLQLHYGPNKQVLTSSMSFWVIPYKLLAVVIVLLIAAFFFIRYLIRRHDDRIMRRMHESRMHTRR